MGCAGKLLLLLLVIGLVVVAEQVAREEGRQEHSKVGEGQGGQVQPADCCGQG